MTPPKRYTMEVVVYEIGEDGAKVDRVLYGGPSEATTDLAGLGNNFDQINMDVQEAFYDACRSGSFSDLHNRNTRTGVVE